MIGGGDKMKCSRCGAEDQTGKFCSECGTPLPTSASISEPERANDTATMQRLGNDKYYEKDGNVIQAALAHKVFADPEKVIMYVGNLFSNLDSYFAFVNSDELIFCKINDKKPENDIISRFQYTDDRLDNFYDFKWSRLTIDANAVGFKPSKILAYAKNWEVIYNEVQRLRGKPFSAPQKEVRGKGQGFWQQVVEQGREINQQKELQKAAQPKPLSKKERIKESKANGVACCPKCGSTSLSANKKGFGIGKAVIGAYVAGPIGLVAGNIHSKKVWVTCLNCGHRWKV